MINVLLALAILAYGAPVQSEVVWYDWQGSIMANGYPFRVDALTCAHRTLPLGSMVLMYYEGNFALVKVTDRGPYCYSEQGGEFWKLPQDDCAKEFDLTPAAMDALGIEYGYNGKGNGWGGGKVFWWGLGDFGD